MPSRRNHRRAIGRVAKWVFLLALLIGPLGVGPSVSAGIPGDCSDSCSCEILAHARDVHEATEVGGQATTVGIRGHTAGDDCEDDCPPGCQDCPCFPHLTVGVGPAPSQGDSSPHWQPAPLLASDSPAIGNRTSLFRPPRTVS